MDRRHLLAKLAVGFTLGAGWRRWGVSDGTAGASPAVGSGPHSPTISSSPAASPTGGSAGSASIDPTNLATYTSDTPPYTIEYPAPWRVTVSQPKDVRFSAPARPGRMFNTSKTRRVEHRAPQDDHRDRHPEGQTDVFPRSGYARGSADHNAAKWPPATVINARVRRSSSSMLLRGTFLVAHVRDTVYGGGSSCLIVLILPPSSGRCRRSSRRSRSVVLHRRDRAAGGDQSRSPPARGKVRGDPVGGGDCRRV